MEFSFFSSTCEITSFIQIFYTNFTRILQVLGSNPIRRLFFKTQIYFLSKAVLNPLIYVQFGSLPRAETMLGPV